MKRICIFIVLFIILFVNLISSEFKNKDKAKSLTVESKLVWAVDSAEKDILSAISLLQADKETGNVYVFDQKQFKFYAFDKNGKFLFSFGRKGEGPGEFKGFVISSFLVDDSFVVCSDGKISYFDKKTGKLAKIYNTFNFPTGKVSARSFIDFVDKDCFLYLKEEKGKKAKNAFLIKYNIKSKQMKELVKSKISKKLVSKSTKMTISLINPIFSNALISAYNKGYIYAAYNDKYLIGRYLLNGDKKGSFSIEGRDRKTITQKEKEEMYSNLKVNGVRNKELIKTFVNLTPDEYVYFLSFMWDKNGLMYVQLPFEDKSENSSFDVFNEKGKYLYKLKFQLPKPYIKPQYYTLSGNYLYVRAYNSEEEESFLLKLEIKLPPVK